MDHERFAALTRQFAAAGSRRAAVRAVVAAAAGVFGVAGPAAPEAAAAFCRFPGQECTNDGQCCALTCEADGTCGCKPKGEVCYQKFGLSCCSRKCRKGKCR